MTLQSEVVLSMPQVPPSLRLPLAVSATCAFILLAVWIATASDESTAREESRIVAVSEPAPRGVRRFLRYYPLPLPRPGETCGALVSLTPADQPAPSATPRCTGADIAKLNAAGRRRSIAPNSRPAVLARLPLAGGGEHVYGLFRTRAGHDCGFQFGPGALGRPFGAIADCLEGPDRCTGVCLDLGGRIHRDGRVDWVVVGDLPTATTTLRLRFADGSERDLVADGPGLVGHPKREAFLAEIGSRAPRRQEARVGDRVIASRTLRPVPDRIDLFPAPQAPRAPSPIARP